MRIRALLASWRGWAGDLNGEVWSDEELLGYLAEGQDEAAMRRVWIVDADTPEVCNYTVHSGEPLIPIHRSILRPRTVALDSARIQLPHVYAQDMAPIEGWEGHAGTPTKWISNYSDQAIRLYPIPVQDDHIHLNVWRLPIRQLELDGEVEVKRVWERRLLHWVTYRAFLKPGPKTFDPSRAMTGLSEFEATFGGPRDRVWERLDG